MNAPATAPLLRRRSTIALAGAALFAAILGNCVRESWAIVAIVVALEGIITLAWLGAALLVGGAILRRWRAGPTDPMLAIPSAAGLGLGVIGLLTLGLGLAGSLNTTTAWAIVLVPAAIAGADLLLAHRERLSGLSMSLPVGRWLAGESRGGWIWLILPAFLAIALAGACVMPGLLWKPDDPHPYDVLVYHLQIPREWYEAGRIIPLHHNVFSYFPFGVEIQYLLAMHLRQGPWEAMYQAQFMSIAYTLLSAMAIYGIIRPLASARQATLGAMAALGLPWLVMLSCVAYVESGLVFYTTLAIAWCLRWLNSAQHRSAALAGAFAGLACGVKYTAVPMLLVAAPVVLLGTLLIRRPASIAWRRRLAAGVLFAGVGTAVFSPWLIRNYIWTGNPVFPLMMRQLGAANYTPDQVTRFQRAHSPRPDQQSIAGRLHAGVNEIAGSWKYGFIFLPAALVALVAARRQPEALFAGGMLLATGAVWIGATHLLGRFFVPAIPAAAVLIGIAPLPQRPLAWLLGAATLFCWIGPKPAPPHNAQLPELSSIRASLEGPMELARDGLFGLKDTSAFNPLDLDRLLDSERKLAFIGDSQAFLRQIPQSRFTYRVVFDVDCADGRDLIDAWYAARPGVCPDDVVPIIDIRELARLSRTYYGIYPLDPASEKRFRQVLIIP